MRYFIFSLLTIASLGIAGQSTFNGIVYGADNNQPLIGANISCGEVGTTTDIEGRFSIVVVEGCKPVVSYLGYHSFIVEKIQEDLTIVLQPNSENLDVLVVTGSKYKRRLSESTVSVEVLSPDLISSVNGSKGDEILNKIPGVQTIGGQANIRGGSGFSYGSGSRVMILIDDLPALQSDAGFANWSDLPLENLDQVEVLKGAASSLYGSAALNGIVNFRRKKPTSTPQTDLFIANTLYLNPAISISKWWDTPRYQTNIGVSHVQKYKKLDINAHGFYGVLESYKKDTYEYRQRLGLNLKYHISDRLKIGINSMINLNDGQNFFLWDNDLRGLYKPFPNTLSAGKRTRIFIDPFVEYRDSNNNKHSVKVRYALINNNNAFDRSNQSSSTFAEYQFQRDFSEHNLILTTGMAGSSARTTAELYGDTSFNFQNIGLFVQAEKTIGKFILSGGTRYEYNKQKGPEVFNGVEIPSGIIDGDALVSRLGLNYSLNDFSALRASWGQGYRYPTISERYIQTSFGGFNVISNPLLKSEKGWTAELAYKQGFGTPSLNGFIDVALFSSRYFNMIEFAFLSDALGFKPINVGDTQIDGLELSFTLKSKVKSVNLTALGGYTFINPFYKNFEERPEIKDNISTDQNVLKYRSKHSAKVDIQADWNNFFIGLSAQHYSHHTNIDKKLETPFDGTDLIKIRAFRQNYPNGYQIIDTRLGYTWNKLKLNLIIANIINEVYAIRPGSLEAPRNITLRLDYKF